MCAHVEARAAELGCREDPAWCALLRAFSDHSSSHRFVSDVQSACDEAALKALLDHHLRKQHFLTTHAVVAALTRLAKLRGPGRLRLSKRLTHLLSTTPEPGPVSGMARRPLVNCLTQRGRANVVWAWAKMEDWPHPQFTRVLRSYVAGLAVPQYGRPEPQQLASVAWALARTVKAGALGAGRLGGRQALQPRAHAGEEGAGGVSAWKAALGDQQALRARPQEAEPGAELGERQALQLLEQIQAAVLQPGVMDGAAPQAWSNLMWSSATVGHASPQLCAHVSRAVVTGGCMRGARPQEWANLLWAFATLRYYNPLLWDCVAAAVVRGGCMRGATPQAWSNMVWAYAKMRYADRARWQQLMATLEEEGRGGGGRQPREPREWFEGLLAFSRRGEEGVLDLNMDPDPDPNAGPDLDPSDPGRGDGGVPDPESGSRSGPPGG